jgi:hypothetical protein
MIAFLPYLKAGEECEVRVTWSWPGCMGRLRERNAEEYGWECDGYDDKGTGDVHMEYVFDKKIGDVKCMNIGVSPSGANLHKTDKGNEIVWSFDAANAPLGKGKEYRFIFERQPRSRIRPWVLYWSAWQRRNSSRPRWPRSNL